MDRIRRSVYDWVLGSPPIGDDVIKKMNEEFSVLLYGAGTFLHPKYWTIHVVLLIFNMSLNLLHVFSLFKTATLLVDDFILASQIAHMGAIDVISLSIFVGMNSNRKNIAAFLTAMSNDFFDYGDDFVIKEMEEEIKTMKKRKLFILILLPTYLVITAACCMLGRSIDEYFGITVGETYYNGVYMLAPIPEWFPFVIDSVTKHWFAGASQALCANIVALEISGFDAMIMNFSQSLAVQYKIIIYRIRKIKDCAYKMHRKNGGKKLSEDEMPNDPSFMKCYNKCLSLNAKHHCIIIKYLHVLETIVKWPLGIFLLCGGLLIAVSLINLIMGGGKPSIMSLAVFAIVAEVSNMAMICSESETLLELGTSLSQELYNIDWMDADLPTKRTMMIMIERSQTPFVLMAGGLVPLNWETFSTVINTAYSYVNVLRAAV